ncbi:beta-lactamase family protein, partial [Vibrio marinisediminis]|uniref:beta-lactamase family protein n=1 Tax=Vibrio marinisediminis TaxID=2758441 RepID=UPI001FE3F132
MQERICGPLGLSRTALFDPTRDDNGRTLPVYHKALRLDVTLILSSMGPDGGLVAGPDDLLVFLRAFMA